jgi:7-keto-8-aminopelargonate synthetase-like enzyme
MGMAILLSSLLQSDDTVLIQRDSHASIMDAARAWAPRFREYDLDTLSTLQRHLEKVSKGRVIVAGEGVSLLFGKVFPLPEVIRILDGREYLVLLDDAHGFGVLGGNGQGTAEHFNLKSENILSCATLSKAFGSYGGTVPVNARQARTIRENSPVYQCSTPIPAPICGAAIAALRYVRKNPAIIIKLAENNRELRKVIASLGFEVDDSPAPIVPLIQCGGLKPRQLSERLFDAGILAPFSTYPGTPRDGMVRLAVTAGHNKEQIARLGEQIGMLI